MARNISVNMTGVESYTRCPEGEWLVRLASIEEATVQGSGDDALKAKFEVIKGQAKGNYVYETFSLGEKALWKLKSFLEAIGMKADGKMRINLDKLEGKVCIVEVIHDEYQGSKRAKIASYAKPEDDTDEDEDEDEDLDDEDEEEEAPRSKKSSKSQPKPPAKKTTKRRSEPEEDEDDEEEEEEDEPPARKKKPAAKQPAKKSSKKAPPPDDDDDDDDDDDWEDDD